MPRSRFIRPPDTFLADEVPVLSRHFVSWREIKILLRKGASMKRHMVLVVLSLAALLGNLAWAGSAREDSTERLQNSARRSQGNRRRSR